MDPIKNNGIGDIEDILDDYSEEMLNAHPFGETYLRDDDEQDDEFFNDVGDDVGSDNNRDPWDD